MPRQFRCPSCNGQIITFMRIGETTSCGQCHAEVVVPQNAEETEAKPKIGPRGGSEELERLGGLEQQVPPPTFRLYSLGAMTVATICGSVLAGLLLASKNFKALGDEDRANRCFWLGVGGIIFMIAGGLALPKEVPTAAFEAVQVGFVMWYSKREQGEMIEAHKAIGGHFYSKWRAAGIGLLLSVAIVGALVGAYLLGILKIPGVDA